MSKEKPILQMLRDGYSQRHIASFLHVSRNTVARVAKAASEHQLPNDVLESMDEVEIRHTLFPEEALIPTLVTPDFPYIHKELLKNGVTLKLLWQEYVDTCRNNGKLQFAPSSGHWCVCQRPLGGAQRPPLLRVFDRLNDNNVVLRCPLHYSVGRYFVIHDHRFPTPRFTLRTDDGTFGCFDAFFKDFHQYFDFPFIHDCI